MDNQIQEDIACREETSIARFPVTAEEGAPQEPLSGTYCNVFQAPETLALLKRPWSDKVSKEYDFVTGQIELQTGIENISLKYPNEKLLNNNALVMRFIDFVMKQYIDIGNGVAEVIFPLTDYMKECKLKDEKTARESLVSIMGGVAAIVIIKKVGSGKNNKARRTTARSYGASVFHIGSGKIKNGSVIFTFDPNFIAAMFSSMPFPRNAFTFNFRDHPNSYIFARYLAQLKHINAGKANENIVSVKKLLEVAPVIPTEEEVREGNRNFYDRICKPFLRDMKALSDNNILRWRYCYSKGEPLTDEDLTRIKNRDYDLFKTLFVYSDWIGYPEQTERVKKMGERRKARSAKQNEN